MGKTAMILHTSTKTVGMLRLFQPFQEIPQSCFIDLAFKTSQGLKMNKETESPKKKKKKKFFTRVDEFKGIRKTHESEHFNIQTNL